MTDGGNNNFEISIKPSTMKKIKVQKQIDYQDETALTIDAIEDDSFDLKEVVTEDDSGMESNTMDTGRRHNIVSRKEEDNLLNLQPNENSIDTDTNFIAKESKDNSNSIESRSLKKNSKLKRKKLQSVEDDFFAYHDDGDDIPMKKKKKLKKKKHHSENLFSTSSIPPSPSESPSHHLNSVISPIQSAAASSTNSPGRYTQVADNNNDNKKILKRDVTPPPAPPAPVTIVQNAAITNSALGNMSPEIETIDTDCEITESFLPEFEYKVPKLSDLEIFSRLQSPATAIAGDINNLKQPCFKEKFKLNIDLNYVGFTKSIQLMVKGGTKIGKLIDTIVEYIRSNLNESFSETLVLVFNKIKLNNIMKLGSILQLSNKLSKNELENCYEVNLSLISLNVFETMQEADFINLQNKLKEDKELEFNPDTEDFSNNNYQKIDLSELEKLAEINSSSSFSSSAKKNCGEYEGGFQVILKSSEKNKISLKIHPKMKILEIKNFFLQKFPEISNCKLLFDDDELDLDDTVENTELEQDFIIDIIPI